jgi:hypothetical protein
MLAEFTTPDSEYDITEILLAAGFPHLNITGERKHLTYECCVIHKIVTKRLAALYDIRKGLQSANFMGNTVIDLLNKWSNLKNKRQL